MSSPSAAANPEKTKVVARIMNGAEWSVLATKRGLVTCLKKYEGNPSKCHSMPSLQEFAQMIRAIEVFLPEDPNADGPVLSRRIKIAEFFASGENYRSTGSSEVAHQRTERMRPLA